MRLRMGAGAVLGVGCLLLAGSAAPETGPSEATWIERLGSGTLPERTAAARWLGLHLVAEARELLNQQFRAAPRDAAHAEFRRTAELMLTLLWVPRLLELHSLDVVMEQLDAPDAHLRASAVRHLAYYAPPGAVERAAPLVDDPVDFVREEALNTLRWLGDRAHTTRALALLDDPGAAVRLRAFEYLIELDRPELLQRFVVVVADPSPWIAETAVRALQDNGCGPAAAAAIFGKLRDDRPADELARYLAALERFEDRVDFPRHWVRDVRALLTHADAVVRRSAAVLIGDADPDAARHVLVALLASNDAADRLAAGLALAAGDWPLEAATIDPLLDDDDAQVRVAAVHLTATLPVERRRALLRRVIERPAEESDVLASALPRLAEVGTADDVALFVALARRATTDHVRMNAVWSMAVLERRWDTHVAREWFREQLDDPAVDRSTRRAVVSALQVAGDPSFLPALAEELRGMGSDDVDYATTLVHTMSVLLGRQVHGAEFPDADVR